MSKPEARTITSKYVAGQSLDEAKQNSGLDDIIKLGSNENVLGPSPQAIAAIQDMLMKAHLYPSTQEAKLLEALAKRIGGGLTPDHFITGNGSCDVLRMITHTVINPGGRAIVAEPTFGMYRILVELFEGEVIGVPLRDYAIDLSAVLQAIDPSIDLIFICNPNNPTGTYLTHKQVADFLAQVPPHILVIFDEAYMEFADAPDFPRMIEFIQAGFNVVVTRTFSKLHGLASLRIGYGLGQPDTINNISERKLHFNGGCPALVGATAAVNDDEFITQSLDMVRQGRLFFYQELANLGIGCLPSQSNFIFLTDLPRDAGYICEQALQWGVILRQTTPFGLPNNIRITIGRQTDNERVIAVLKEIL